MLRMYLGIDLAEVIRLNKCLESYSKMKLNQRSQRRSISWLKPACDVKIILCLRIASHLEMG